jgi:hypothetical protein
MRVRETSGLLNLVQLQGRLEGLLWHLNSCPAAIAARSGLLEAHEAAALNAPLAHWRKTCHRRAASLTLN